MSFKASEFVVTFFLPVLPITKKRVLTSVPVDVFISPWSPVHFRFVYFGVLCVRAHTHEDL